MRRAARIDDNQTAVVKELRAAGCEVYITSALGNGFPDLVVKRERLLLVELKDPSKVPSARKLTPDEEVFADRFGDSVITAETSDQIIAALRSPTVDELRWRWLSQNCSVRFPDVQSNWCAGTDHYGNVITLKSWVDRQWQGVAA